MVKSMTGFGRSQKVLHTYRITCEIKGVNHRYFDLHIRIPRRYSSMEERIKEELKKCINRGRLEVNINIEREEEPERHIKVDKELAIAYYNYLKELAEKLNISQEIRAIELFNLPEVFSLEIPEEDSELLWSALKATLDEAIKEFLELRANEGRNLASDILDRIDLIYEQVLRMEERSPVVAREYYTRLHQRIAELLTKDLADEQRIIQEAAIFADKSNITEEIVRLKSHINHLKDLMDGESVGRKCDFLVQEMFRETNTIASKGNDLEISQIVVDIKAELEKIREQLQNIE
ncbi:MAG: YicC/YloC family endoribonuclease [Syntrophomonadaceae bacterium]